MYIIEIALHIICCAIFSRARPAHKLFHHICGSSEWGSMVHPMRYTPNFPKTTIIDRQAPIKSANKSQRPTTTTWKVKQHTGQ